MERRQRAVERQARRQLMLRLEADAALIARRFGLRYRSLEAERANVRSHYGICYSDGRICIRLQHAKTRRPLKYSSLVNTLCHELAHLRHFNHGPRFKAFYLSLLEYARREGIYRPGPDARAPAAAALPVPRSGRLPGIDPGAGRPADPRQLTLAL
jgi:predicted metal-dependent hydrolase